MANPICYDTKDCRYSYLRLSDQKCIRTLQTAFNDVISDAMLCEYIESRKQSGSIGEVEALVLKEREQAFLAYIRSIADDYIRNLISEIIEDYEMSENEEGAEYRKLALEVLRNK